MTIKEAGCIVIMLLFVLIIAAVEITLNLAWQHDNSVPRLPDNTRYFTVHYSGAEYYCVRNRWRPYDFQCTPTAPPPRRHNRGFD